MPTAPRPVPGLTTPQPTRRAPLPSLDFLRGFDAAARSGSFTKAADLLALTQSAVSRQVKALEDSLGVALFVRSERGLTLTPEGRQLHDVVIQALSDLDAVARRIAHRADDGTVVVGTTLSLASIWLVPRLADLQRRHPELRIRLAADNALAPLATSDLDVSIRYCNRDLAGDAAELLFNEEVTPVCTPAFLQQHPEVASGDLGRVTLIHMDIGHRPWPWVTWQAWFEATGRPSQDGPALWLSHYEHVVEAALNSQGVALGRMPMIDRLLRAGSLVAPLGASVGVDRQARGYYLVTAPGARRRASVRTFCSWVLDQGQGQGQDADL